jgi:hypothetical protein
MATEQIISIKKFLGLNENPDGDTVLKRGELAYMRNFRITQDGHLQIRPGTKAVIDLYSSYEEYCEEVLGDDPVWERDECVVQGAWRGEVAGKVRILCVYAGLIMLVNVDSQQVSWLGALPDDDAVNTVHFFGFGDKAYMLGAGLYWSWDGNVNHQFAAVDGYIPLVQTATSPAGDGTLLEPINRLTAKRRVLFSPDGASTPSEDFHLPEKGLASVNSVTVNGTALTTGWTANTTTGVVTITPPPAAGTNTLEIEYSASASYATQVTNMRFSELFNGAQDTRVFLYGDGSNKAIYSGIPYATGKPSAEYFPDLYEVAVGESNTPITSLVRHYSRLMAFKPNSTYSIQFGNITLEDGTLTAAFYTTPVNRAFGNEAPGQAKILENSPVTIDAGSAYRWVTNRSGYVSAIENNLERISDRAVKTIGEMPAADIRTYNLKREHEFWFVCGDTALILNYGNDTWYIYKDLPFSVPIETETQTYGFGNDGRFYHFDRVYLSDNGEQIECRAVTGAMDLGKDYLIKYDPCLYVALQPETSARITVTVEDNRRSDYPEREIAYSMANFTHVNFAHWSFRTNNKPQVRRVKLHVRRATYLRIIYKSKSASATATVIQTDIRFRNGTWVRK